MIIANELTKKFGNFIAVNNLNLSIQRGESYGFLGPNGAGKTTTLLMLLGLLEPTRGEVLIDGKIIHNNSFDIKRRIGVVTENQAFYDEMTAWEYLMFFGKLYSVNKPTLIAEELLERVELLNWKNMSVGSFSTGMRKKLGFIRALIHSPDILILDEPVSGLDPFGIIQIRRLILDEKRKGTTMIISSHILSEVEQTVDRVGIISKGKLLLEDTILNLQNRFGINKSIYVSLVNQQDDVIESLRALSFVKEVNIEGSIIEIVTPGDKDYRKEIGRFLLEKQAVVVEMRQNKSSLEEAFITITDNNLTTVTKREL